mmetsp:Transcript_37088/g.57987  ORF Transcript_37088/g.57987 Transcript_37088/m.57987 type:complete len:97 (-) Transcript_37088:35-325(-)
MRVAREIGAAKTRTFHTKRLAPSAPASSATQRLSHLNQKLAQAREPMPQNAFHLDPRYGNQVKTYSGFMPISAGAGGSGVEEEESLGVEEDDEDQD